MVAARHRGAPTTASLPTHVAADLDDEDSGPLHHRFAIANYGYVPPDVLNASIEDGLGVAVSLGRLRPDEAGGTRAGPRRDVGAGCPSLG